MSTLALRIRAPSGSSAGSTVTRAPTARSRSATLSAYSSWSSRTPSTRTCSGDSQVGKCPGVVLEQDGEEPLDRSEQGPVDHDRPVPGVVGPDVLDPETLGRLEVELDGGHLVGPPDGVAACTEIFGP